MSYALSTKRAATSSADPFAAVKNNRRTEAAELALHDVLSLSIDDNTSGKTGFDCLEIAARVMEIHYPGLPIAQDMRKLVNKLGQLK